MYLVEHLAKENASIYVSDINNDRLKQVANKHGATVIEANKLYDLDVDIYAPCAMGATINDASLKD